jgi:hypothetical protein
MRAICRNLRLRGLAHARAVKVLGSALPAVALVEADARIGLRFEKQQRGVVAGLVRLGWNFHFREQAPMPQLGVVLGVALL